MSRGCSAAHPWLFGRLLRSKPDEPHPFLAEIADRHRLLVADYPQGTKQRRQFTGIVHDSTADRPAACCFAVERFQNKHSARLQRSGDPFRELASADAREHHLRHLFSPKSNSSARRTTAFSFTPAFSAVCCARATPLPAGSKPVTVQPFCASHTARMSGAPAGVR